MKLKIQASLACLILFGAINPSLTSAHGMGVWNSASARDKAMKIISAALATNGRTGGQCKTWVQAVVTAASGAHVQIPLNTAEVTSTWQPDRTGHVRNIGSDILAGRPGDIVQMIIRDINGNQIGHTAIIGSNDGSKIVWLESNYRGDGKVTTNRTQTIQNFQNSLVQGQYTVYRIS